MNGLPNLHSLALLTVLIIVWCAYVVLALTIIWDGVLTGRLSPSVAFGLLFWLFMGLVGTEVVANLIFTSIFAKWWKCRGLWYGTGTRARWYVILSFLIVVAKGLFAGAVMGMMISCWEMWIAQT